ncbi:NABP1 [Ictidomys tridecemlineatus]|uniref:SOSS complex subunit B2 n=1 Tax=Ictidomys tridecemlineatus TaxID=43179 RepID=A0A287CWH5_ICTTR|nr:NABP1 [Ictidomys tridecemlineatus]
MWKGCLMLCTGRDSELQKIGEFVWFIQKCQISVSPDWNREAHSEQKTDSMNSNRYSTFGSVGNGLQTGPESRGHQLSYANRSNVQALINPQLPGAANNQTVMTTISNGRDPPRAFKR